MLFVGGDANLYVYSANDPVNYVDPSGYSRFDKFYGLPKQFWNWLHKEGDKLEDYTKDEAMDWYDEWKRLGEPRPDSKGKHKGGSDWDDLLDCVIPFPDLLDPCKLEPSMCGPPTA